VAVRRAVARAHNDGVAEGIAKLQTLIAEAFHLGKKMGREEGLYTGHRSTWEMIHGQTDS
jgi:hypothetical protein